MGKAKFLLALLLAGMFLQSCAGRPADRRGYVTVRLDDPEHVALVEAGKRVFPSPPSAYDFLRLYALSDAVAQDGGAEWLVAVYRDGAKDRWKLLPLKKGAADGKGVDVELELLLMIAKNYPETRIAHVHTLRGSEKAAPSRVFREEEAAPYLPISVNDVAAQFVFAVLAEFKAFQPYAERLRTHLVVTPAGIFSITVKNQGAAYREFRKRTADARELRQALDRIPEVPTDIIRGLLGDVSLENWREARKVLQPAGIEIVFAPHRTQERFHAGAGK